MDAKSHSLHFLLFIAMCCKMHAQTICPSKCIVAWVAVVLFFSTVCSQMLLEMVCITWSIITNVALLHVETVSLRNVALWYSMCSRKALSTCQIFTTPNVLSQNIVIYLPHQIQLKCVETVFLLNVKWCIFKCALRFPTNEDAKPHWLH